MKVLIVEDTEDSRVLLESFFEANGYSVDSAENGRIALVKANTTRPDLIISDILMPEMDGYALCKAIKTDPKLQTIPFVFYTATYTDPSDERLAMELGASRFIIKPMEMDIFLSEIKKVLENHRQATLPNSEKPLMDDSELQRNYAATLSRKLDKKVRQLEDEQQKVKARERQYRRLVEVLRDDYFFYTRESDGSYSYVSPSIENVLGYTREEFRAAPRAYDTDNDINKDALRFAADGLRGIKRPPFELEVRDKSGDVHRLEMTEDPVLDKHGKVIAVEGIAHDITKSLWTAKELIKAQERLQHSQKMEAIGTLAGGIAHDFNNILTPIIGYAEMTQFNLQKHTAEWENLQEIISAGHRAKDLVRQILTFSREKKQEKKSVRLQLLIKETLKLLRSSLPATIEIRDYIDDCWPVSADPTQIHQILMNLFTNAYHAMRETGGTLAVSLVEIEIGKEDTFVPSTLPNGRYIRLEISDTGPGIEKGIKERIFEPYFTTKSKDEGTGLGLSVVHGIVTSHGGYITVYSEPGRGTTFHIYLPVLQNVDNLSIRRESEPIAGGFERILVVDDEETICQLEEKQLTHLGYRVTTANSGSKAIEIFKKSPQDIDLVVTDMTMPLMTGTDLAKILLNIRPNLPILLCTGFSELIDKEKANVLGLQGYLMKPVCRKDLAAAVRKSLDRKSLAGKSA
jgi:PAS domain S-box-containing protein